MMVSNNPHLPTVVIKPRMAEVSNGSEDMAGDVGQQVDDGQEVSVRVASAVGERQHGALAKRPGSGGGVETEEANIRVVQSLNTRLCGPRPARMALLCTVLVSVWITWIFLIHLSVKLSVISESLTELKSDLKGSEEHILEDRLQGNHMLLRKLVEMSKASKWSSEEKPEPSSTPSAIELSPSEGKTGSDRSPTVAPIPLHEEW